MAPQTRPMTAGAGPLTRTAGGLLCSPCARAARGWRGPARARPAWRTAQ